MKLLVLVNNYQGVNSENTDAALDRALDALSSYNQFKIDIVLFSTRSYNTGNITNLVYPAELNYDFAYVPRQWLADNMCCLEYDYFMYMENDLIIPESSVISCINCNEFLANMSDRFISGFVRYEIKKEKKYIDMLPSVRPTVEMTFKTDDGRLFWMPGNFHSGNFLLSHRQLEFLVNQNRFQTRFNQHGKVYYGNLESAASDVYLEFIKILPENFTSVEIEHVSNKYDGLTHDELRNAIADKANSS